MEEFLRENWKNSIDERIRKAKGIMTKKRELWENRITLAANRWRMVEV